MRSMTATEVARGFSRVLDSLEQGGDEIVVVRNHHPVARIVPGTPRMTAIEAMGDLYRVIEEGEGESWAADAAASDRLLVAEVRNPWA
jgi:antitoxin (DNA-binding transcriptional repressor) of toxin-antitoxin stability system